MKTKSTKINNKLKRMVEVKEQLEILKAEYESLKEDIIQFMGDETDLHTEDYHVTYTKFSREIFDSKMFKVTHPDMYDIYTKESESHRFSIR